MLTKTFLFVCIGLHVLACSGEGWSVCTNEDERACVTSYPYTLVRYGEDGKYSYAEVKGIGTKIQCDNMRFGDPSKGKTKTCYETDLKLTNPGVWEEPLVADDSQWTHCANEGNFCKPKNLGASGQLCLMKVRYGVDGHYIFRDFEVSSTNSHNGIVCNNGVFGDPISKHSKTCAYYKGGCRPDMHLAVANFTSELRGCAHEGHICKTGVASNFDTVMVRYGVLDVVSGNDNLALWRTVSATDFRCDNGNFADPAHTLAKQCRTWWPEQIASVEGRWALVASGKQISMTLQRGVSRREGKTTTTTLSNSLTVAVKGGMKFSDIFSGEVTVSTTISTSIAEAVSYDTTVTVSQSYTSTCPPLDNGATQYMYQWMMSYDEVADWGEVPGVGNLLVYTAYTLCSPLGPTQPPRCPLTDCVDTDPSCRTCISETQNLKTKTKTEL